MKVYHHEKEADKLTDFIGVRVTSELAKKVSEVSESSKQTKSDVVRGVLEIQFEQKK